MIWFIPKSRMKYPPLYEESQSVVTANSRDKLARPLVGRRALRSINICYRSRKSQIDYLISRNTKAARGIADIV